MGCRDNADNRRRVSIDRSCAVEKLLGHHIRVAQGPDGSRLGIDLPDHIGCRVRETQDPTGLVNDAAGNTNTVSNLLSVNWPAPNRAPIITNPGTQNSTRGSAASLAMQGSDPDGQAITWSTTGLPQGLLINANSGVISGTITTVEYIRGKKNPATKPGDLFVLRAECGGKLEIQSEMAGNAPLLAGSFLSRGEVVGVQPSG